MTKHELRTLYLEKRKLLTEAEVKSASECIFSRFSVAFPVTAGQKFHVFISISKFNEVHTAPFINELWEKGARVFVPKMLDGEIISVEIFPDTEMIQNSWGIREPESNKDARVKDFDYIITPLLYCDRSGGRVGYGKGFYDRFFATLEPNCSKVGVGFFAPGLPVADLTKEDVPLDYLVTPDEILSFRIGC